MSHSKPSLAAKLLVSLAVLIVTALLAGYGACKYRLENKDLGFVQGQALTRIFPSSWLLRGHGHYYNELNLKAAAKDYQEAIRQNPLLFEAWIYLARVRLGQGNEKQASHIQEIIGPKLSQVSTWKWEETLLAFELEKEKYFADCFNFALARLPGKRREACYLAAKFWGSWEAASSFVKEKNYQLFLGRCMRARKMEAALRVWDKIEQPDRDQGLYFCNLLLSQGELSRAKRLWQDIYPGQKQPIYNRGFEKKILDRAFAWRKRNHPQVQVGLSTAEHFQGRQSLHLAFSGKANVNFHHFYQIIALDPGHAYKLRFSQKARELSTDQGVYIQISCYKCQGLNQKSEQVLGTVDWQTKSLRFDTPKNCRAVLLRLRRDKSLMFDNKISGDFWLDDLRLKNLGPGPLQDKNKRSARL